MQTRQDKTRHLKLVKRGDLKDLGKPFQSEGALIIKLQFMFFLFLFLFFVFFLQYNQYEVSK